MLKIANKLNLSAKFLPPILAGTLIGLLTGAFLLHNAVRQGTEDHIAMARQALQEEQQSAEQSQLEALTSKSDVIGQFMAKTAPDFILSYDFTALKDFQEQAARDRDVAYTAFLKPDGSPLTDYQAPEEMSGIIENRYPIVSDGETLGSVLIGMSKRSVQGANTASERRIEAAIASVQKTGRATLNTFSSIVGVVTVLLMAFIATIIVVLFRIFVVRPLRETTELMKGLSQGQGDLTVTLPIHYQDEIGALRKATNGFIGQLRKMIGTIAQDVSRLSEASGTMRQFSNEQRLNSDNQLEETTQVATSMNEMIAAVQEVANNANAAAGAAQEADSAAHGGSQIVDQTIGNIERLAAEVERATGVIHELEKDSDSIGTVLDVIRGIAEQTNLLALNAAIEAARAGEQGRGFAVVADEVRTLASRTQQSTQEIHDMIERLQSGASNAVQVMEQGRSMAQNSVTQAGRAGESLQAITRAVETINQMNTQIASAAEQQSTTTEEVNRNIHNLNQVASNSAEYASQTAVASEELADLAGRLQGLVGQFRT